MKTTIDINPALFKRAKLYAVHRGATLKSLIESALEHELSMTASTVERKRLKFPIIKSKHPGKLTLTNEQIEEFLA